MKMKTHSGAKKRLRTTGKGKVKRRQPGLRHLLSKHSSKNKRHLGKMTYIHPADMNNIKDVLVL